VVIATGISSVVTQLLTIREFLTQFQGNEMVIALILFNWLILGGIGTLLARAVTYRLWKATPARLCWLSLCLSGFAALQILAIRQLRDVFFIYGSSVGFYPTWLYTLCTVTPYCLLLGFVLPYSLFVLRNASSGYPGARIYITDNIGDVCGGALFSFALVYLVTPLQAIFLAHIPLLITTYLLFPIARRHRPMVVFALALVIAVLARKASLFITGKPVTVASPFIGTRSNIPCSKTVRRCSAATTSAWQKKRFIIRWPSWKTSVTYCWYPQRAGSCRSCKNTRCNQWIMWNLTRR
jgi:hypothetical protein